MKVNMLIFSVLCMFLCWMLPVESMKISVLFNLPKAHQGTPMNMVEDSVDDMYFGCNKTMTKCIRDKYFKKENTGKFGKAWKTAQGCATRNLEQKDTEDAGLTKDHMQAICVYTSYFYETFNTATKEGLSSFKFHSLHFWLTSAVQILNNDKACHTTYRRTKHELSANVNQIIRFGFFVSSSFNPRLTDFGSETCFKIKTCSGAPLKKYPALKDKEEEVLIPPYEKFKITEKKKGPRSGVKDLENCKVVYVLESAGIHSNLNCNAVP